MKISLFKTRVQRNEPSSSLRLQGDLPKAAGAKDAYTFVQAQLTKVTTPNDEYQILETLKCCSIATLNDILIHSDLERMFQSIDDHIFGQSYRMRLFQILSNDRISQLTVAAKAAVINALQVGATCRDEERVIRQLIYATNGSELTALKNLIDAGDNYRDLAQLIYHDIDDDQIRQDILRHIACEGLRLRDSDNYVPALKVLSDIDDTTLVMLYDTKLTKKTVYPGVSAFYDALDAGVLTMPDRMGDKTFVSARPTDRMGMIEAGSLKTLHKAGFQGVTVQTGDFWSLRSKQAMGEKKVENFALLKGLYPEYNFVFTGDSGQGDVLFARSMRENASAIVPATFIHDVWLKDGPKTSESERQELANEGVYFFDTYLGAIAKAFELGLLSPERAAEAALQTLSDFSNLDSSAFVTNDKRLAYEELLQADLSHLNAILPESLKIA